MESTFKDIRNNQKKINLTDSGDNMLFTTTVGDFEMQVIVDRCSSKKIMKKLKKFINKQ